MDDLLEILAEAMRHPVDGDEMHQFPPYRNYARRALSALSSKGLAIIPIEPTPEMLAAPLHEQDACDAQYETDEAFRAAWTDMIAASPYQKGQ